MQQPLGGKASPTTRTCCCPELTPPVLIPLVVVQIDRLFDWKAQTDAPIQQSLNSQKEHVKREFDERLKQSVLNLNEQGLNVALYWQNPDKRKYVNVVPTSAITGEGLPDMLQLLVDLTQVNTPFPPPAPSAGAYLQHPFGYPCA